jgi:DNA invertase Pin-like site-specific DNA recombinase
MNIAIYSRVSTDKQDNANQLLDLRRFAAKQNWNVVLEFVDTATGGTSDREQFQKMFQAAERKEFDLVLFWSLDRLTREGTLATLLHIQKLASFGVGYKSHEEQYLDSNLPFNDSLISLKADMAREEKKRISQRTKAGLATARAKGVKLGRPAGTKFNFDLFRQLRSEGMELRKIAWEMDCSVSLVRLYANA